MKIPVKSSTFPNFPSLLLLTGTLLFAPEIHSAEPAAEYKALAALLDKAGADTDEESFRRDARVFLTAAAAYLQEHPDDAPVWTLRTRTALELGRVTEARDSAIQMRRLNLDKAYNPVYWHTIQLVDRLVAKSFLPDATNWAYPKTLPVDEPAPVAAAAGGRTAQAWKDLDPAARLGFTLLDQRMRKLAGDWDQPEAVALLKAVKHFNLEHADYARGWQMQAQLALALNQKLEGAIAARNLRELGLGSSPLLALLQKRGWITL
jgi:hypothetical protein